MSSIVSGFEDDELVVVSRAVSSVRIGRSEDKPTSTRQLDLPSRHSAIPTNSKPCGSRRASRTLKRRLQRRGPLECKLFHLIIRMATVFFSSLILLEALWPLSPHCSAARWHRSSRSAAGVQYVATASFDGARSPPSPSPHANYQLEALEGQKQAREAPKPHIDTVEEALVAPHSRANSKRERSDDKTPQRRDLIEFLESLPVSSVGQKHSALFECEPDEKATRNPNFKLVWLKLIRNDSSSATNSDDITLLSLNKRIITPDKRFKVHHRPPSKWSLTLENVGPTDDKAYYLCQVGGQQQSASRSSGGQGVATNFIGGARLNVLVPPKIVESETSPGLVQVDELANLKLHCKVVGEPQSQLSWRREDGKSLEGTKQRFKHQLDRKVHQLISIDSSELDFGPVRREQVGAYLCIASNGVQPGVSQRISVQVENCRDSSDKPEPCEQETPSEAQDEGATEWPTTSSTTRTTPMATSVSSTTSRRPMTSQMGGWTAKRTNWTSSRADGKSNFDQQQMQLSNSRRQQTGAKFETQTDKTRSNLKYNHNNELARRLQPSSRHNNNKQAERAGGSSSSGGTARPHCNSFARLILAVCICSLSSSSIAYISRPQTHSEGQSRARDRTRASHSSGCRARKSIRGRDQLMVFGARTDRRWGRARARR